MAISIGPATKKCKYAKMGRIDCMNAFLRKLNRQHCGNCAGRFKYVPDTTPTGQATQDNSIPSDSSNTTSIATQDTERSPENATPQSITYSVATPDFTISAGDLNKHATPRKTEILE